jgi:uncharacterized surface protein with fasciclin (FAS1) repeats
MQCNGALAGKAQSFVFGFFLCILTAISAGCGDNIDPTPRTIADHIRSDIRFASLEGLLGQAELMDALDGPGPYTLFAPTDDAFDALLVDPAVPSRDWLALPKLAELVRYHLHAGEISATDLERVTALATLEGPEIHVRLTLDGVVLNDGIKIQSEPIEARMPRPVSKLPRYRLASVTSPA